jgi:hypothetical protein
MVTLWVTVSLFWWGRYGPRTVLLLFLCLCGALLPIFVRRRCLKAAGALPVRLSAAAEQLQHAAETSVTIFVGAESPRTGAKLVVRQHSGLGAGCRQFVVNGAAVAADAGG